jgi:hypothetical protein
MWLIDVLPDSFFFFQVTAIATDAVQQRLAFLHGGTPSRPAAPGRPSSKPSPVVAPPVGSSGGASAPALARGGGESDSEEGGLVADSDSDLGGYSDDDSPTPVPQAAAGRRMGASNAGA